MSNLYILLSTKRMPDFVSSPANFCHLLLSFVGYFDVFPNLYHAQGTICGLPGTGVLPVVCLFFLVTPKKFLKVRWDVSPNPHHYTRGTRLRVCPAVLTENPANAIFISVLSFLSVLMLTPRQQSDFSHIYSFSRPCGGQILLSVFIFSICLCSTMPAPIPNGTLWLQTSPVLGLPLVERRPHYLVP